MLTVQPRNGAISEVLKDLEVYLAKWRKKVPL